MGTIICSGNVIRVLCDAEYVFAYLSNLNMLGLHLIVHLLELIEILLSCLSDKDE